MITRDSLKGACSEGEALAICHEMRRQGNFAAVCRSFMHDEDYQVARNMLWALTKVSRDEIAQLQPMLHELIDLAMTTANPSVRRLALNVVERLAMPIADVRGDFLNFCLDHATDVAEYPGIQSLCLKLAHRMSLYFPEILSELHRILLTLPTESYSPALLSVRRRILTH